MAALLLGLLIYFDTTLQRTPALGGEGHPQQTAGTNWLLVGSDSRAGLDESRRDELGTGQAQGRRTDTMMVLHIPDSGNPTLVSLPRDSYVSIPGHGKSKLNSAFAYGGPELLTRTVEGATGLRMDHYAEIGLGGFADLTDAVGGVDMCVKEPMHDPKAGLNLNPGCQELDGQQALGYVRTRATARGDLDRVEHQREFLGALVGRAASPTTLLNPFRLFPLLNSAPKAFMVDENDHLWNLASLAWAMSDITGGSGATTTVPLGGFGRADGESVIKWDRQEASQLFGALAQDQPVPPDLLGK